ncbi:MAG: ABC transporter permease subunit [Rhodospirillaceae bacterium]|nr:ABC transporter permease subunit [Rhodospirillaceae bacterium]
MFTGLMLGIPLGLIAASRKGSWVDKMVAGYSSFSLAVPTFVIGIVFIYRQVLRLAPEAAWLAAARTNVPGQSVQRAPRLLAPLATMIAERRGRVSLNAVSMRSVLDGIGSRLDESHELARYLIGLLIFLGLLGTFWGLLQTVSSVGDVIGGLSVGGEDLGSAFDDLKGGLEAPLAGMGTAFSSSLFGLAGSLVLGFLELQASQAQNRFYNDLEDWLSSHTRLTGGTLSVEGGDQSVPAYVSALLERTADSLDDLQRTLARGEDNRASSSANLLSLTERLATLTDQMRAEQDLMVKLVENQMEMRPVLERLAESGRQPVTLDEASRAHLRNLDVYVNRLLEEMVAGREQSVNELRSEFKLLARTIAAVAENERRDGRK